MFAVGARAELTKVALVVSGLATEGFQSQILPSESEHAIRSSPHISKDQTAAVVTREVAEAV